MRLYIDDDSVDPGLIRLLRRDGHDVQVPADVGLAGSSDQAHLAHAIRDQRAILTRNHGDFDDLHDLVVSAAHGHHAGILAVRYDNNPRNNMSCGDIARAVRNLENAGVAIADSYHELNHWQ
jgi:predicted nuclease of predicted toxin-antitoxin system